MKKIFWLGILGLICFEIANVYFIMPLPGSQRMNSIRLAYFLYSWRWIFRILFLLMIVVGFLGSQWKRKWLLIFPFGLAAIVVYMTNFKMAADHMFYQPRKLLMVNATTNRVDSNRLVIGVVNNGEAKAYPVQFLGFHHQVQDSVGGKPVMITYCTVCRTAAVFEPVVNGNYEKFRLVGMDHFNAMFEDETTKSWWRQMTGEAVAGKLTGKQLPELFHTQTSLAEWLRLNPNSLIMQADPTYVSNYDSTLKFENGSSKSKLTGTDSVSWNEKSWVIGVKVANATKAYDWKQLRGERIIRDKINKVPIALILAKDNQSFFAFQLENENDLTEFKNDTLMYNRHYYRLNGEGIDTIAILKSLQAYQVFWHSWKTFHPETKK